MTISTYMLRNVVRSVFDRITVVMRNKLDELRLSSQKVSYFTSDFENNGNIRFKRPLSIVMMVQELSL